MRGAGDDRADAGEREDAVDGKAKAAGVVAGRGRCACRVEQHVAQCRNARAGRGRHDSERRIGERRRGDERAHLAAHFTDPLRADAVRLRDDERAAAAAEQAQDREVLACLRHDAVVGGDEEKREVDAGRAREHRRHQPLMAGHVDEADALAGRAVDVEIRVAQLDADAAPLLLRQAIGVDAGERAHQRRLAVVDMAGGADDHGVPSGLDASLARPAPSVNAAASAGS